MVETQQGTKVPEGERRRSIAGRVEQAEEVCSGGQEMKYRSGGLPGGGRAIRTNQFTPTPCAMATSRSVSPAFNASSGVRPSR
jgi:hypothetical protein